MSLRVITAPSSEIITVAEAAEFLRLDDNGDSPPTYPDQTTLESFITTARHWCEEYLRRAIGVQTLEIVLNNFPKNGIFLRPPVIGVTSVKYIDTNGSEQTLSSSDYRVATDNEPAIITLSVNSSWPAILNVPDAVRVRYQAGYTDEGDSPSYVTLPKTIKTAMLMQIADLYQNRESQTEKQLNANPTLERLLSVYRLEMGI